MGGVTHTAPSPRYGRGGGGTGGGGCPQAPPISFCPRPAFGRPPLGPPPLCYPAPGFFFVAVRASRGGCCPNRHPRSPPAPGRVLPLQPFAPCGECPGMAGTPTRTPAPHQHPELLSPRYASLLPHRRYFSPLHVPLSLSSNSIGVQKRCHRRHPTERRNASFPPRVIMRHNIQINWSTTRVTPVPQP